MKQSFVDQPGRVERLARRARATAVPFQPSRNAKCFCGSGEKFKRCCGEEGAPTSDSLDRYEAAIKDGNHLAAVRHLRAHIAWYRICHRKHTIPWVRSDPDGAGEILKVDIEALSELVELLIRSYYRLGWGAELDELLSRFEGAIADKRWVEKIDYLYVIAALGLKWNEGRARKVIEKRCRVDKIEDFALLAICFDVCRSRFTQYQAIAVSRRLSGLADRDVDKLHYRASEAAHLFLLGERDTAVEGLRGAIEDFRSAASGRDLSQEEEDWLSQCLCTLATLGRDPSVLLDARRATVLLLHHDNWTSAGRARLCSRLAELAKAEGHYSEAAAHYLGSYELSGDDVDLLLSAECQLAAGESLIARATFARVGFNSLDEAGQLDYALMGPGFVIDSGDIAAIKLAKELLFNTPVPPLFQKQQLKTLRLLDEALLVDPGKVESRARGLMDKFLVLLNRYAELKPSLAGVGLNINAMIADVTERGTDLHAGIDDEPKKGSGSFTH